MQHIDWQVPKRVRGKHRTVVTLKLAPAFAEALRLYAAMETKRAGRQIGQSSILSTLALRGDPNLRRLCKQLEAEALMTSETTSIKQA